MGDHCWIVAGMLAEHKQLIHASQIGAHKTLSAPESPLSLCYVTDRESRGKWDCACEQNLNTWFFVPYAKLTSACVLKAVMADWNRSTNFDISCIRSGIIIIILHQHVSVTPVSYCTNTINIQRKIQKCMIRPFHVHFHNMFINAFFFVYHISTKYSLMHGCGTHKRINWFMF